MTAPSSPPPRRRPLTFLEKQPYLAAYGGVISVFSPGLTAWQLCKVYKRPEPNSRLAMLSMRIWPHQTLLKLTQMNMATPVKENLNPWAAFALVGVLQGAVYGQCNVHFARVLELSNNASMKGIFRGALFAGGRDSLSQGIPFVFSDTTQRWIYRPVWRALGLDASEGTWSAGVMRAASVMSTSVVATVLSQGMHNCQIRMQADQSLSYLATVSTLWKEHGPRILYKGASARIALLLIVCGLNEVLIKPAWEGVEEEDE